MNEIRSIYPAAGYDDLAPDDTPTADAWFWSVGNCWVAVVAEHSRLDWFDIGDETAGVYADRPDLWCMPISEIPETGTLAYRQWGDDGTLAHISEPVPYKWEV